MAVRTNPPSFLPPCLFVTTIVTFILGRTGGNKHFLKQKTVLNNVLNNVLKIVWLCLPKELDLGMQ